MTKGKTFYWRNLGFRSDLIKGNTWRFKLYHDDLALYFGYVGKTKKDYLLNSRFLTW